jgi:hypothetical protein
MSGYLRDSTLALLGALVLAWLVSRLPRYRTIGLVVAAANAYFLTGQTIAAGDRPAATLTALAAFVLLAGGAAVSWHKHTLLRAACADAPPGPASATAAPPPENASNA